MLTVQISRFLFSLITLVLLLYKYFILFYKHEKKKEKNWIYVLKIKISFYFWSFESLLEQRKKRAKESIFTYFIKFNFENEKNFNERT